MRCVGRGALLRRLFLASAVMRKRRAPATRRTKRAGTAGARLRDASERRSHWQHRERQASRRGSDKRRAAKLYLEASKLFVDSQFEEAFAGLRAGGRLDPTNADYRLAAEVARSHAVTALIQAAAKDRLVGDERRSARRAVQRARARPEEREGDPAS